MWKRFNDLLREKQTSVYRMAKETGLDASQLSRYRNGHQKPNAANLVIIADYFRVSIDSLLKEESYESNIT